MTSPVSSPVNIFILSQQLGLFFDQLIYFLNFFLIPRDCKLSRFSSQEMSNINNSGLIDAAVPFPQGNFVQAVRTSCHDCRERSCILVMYYFHLLKDDDYKIILQ